MGLCTTLLTVALSASPAPRPWQLTANPAYEPGGVGLVPLEENGAEEDGVTPDASDIPDKADTDPTLRYSADVSDGDLEKRFLDNINSLGSMSVGYCEAGRLINV